jgi:hypothetical protein
VRIILFLFIAIFSFAKEPLPLVSIGIYDSNDTLINPNKKDTFTAAGLTLKPYSNYKVKLFFSDIRVKKGQYYFISTYIPPIYFNNETCFQEYHFTICPIVYNKT